MSLFSFCDTISNISVVYAIMGLFGFWYAMLSSALGFLSCLNPIIGEFIIVDSETIWEESGREDDCLLQAMKAVRSVKNVKQCQHWWHFYISN